MSTEKKEERTGFDYLWNLRQEEEKKEREAKAQKRAEELMLEISAIYDRAFEAAINKKYAEYQQRINAPELTQSEKEALEAELNDFKQNPEKYGLIRTKTPITDEFDQRRILEIVEELKDKEGLAKDKEPELLKMIDGYAERHAQRMEAQNKQVSGRGD